MEEQTATKKRNKPAQELTLVEDQPKAIVETRQYDATPGGLLEMAIARGADLDKIEHYMKLKREWEADEARKAFVAAMAEFKQDPPQIFKTKEVAFSGTSYKHATLGDVTAAITPALAKVGISHKWTVDQSKPGRIVVTCVLTHKLGHSESVSMESGADDSGKKNAIQAVASAINYMQRYTLLSATGLSTHDEKNEDDGAGSEPPELLDANQVTEIKRRISEYAISESAFLKWAKCESIEEIVAAAYNDCLVAIEATHEKKKAAAGGKA